MPLRTNIQSAADDDLSDLDTEGRLLSVAIRMFAERGFDKVSVRDITYAAGANGAAVSYYFRSKEKLIQSAIREVLAPVNKARMAALDKCEAQPAQMSVEDVVRALVLPTIQCVKDSEGTGRFYLRYTMLCNALRSRFIDEAVEREHDRVALRFIGALSRALPNVGKEEICWRYDFLIGALIEILFDADRAHRLRRLSDGLCDTDDGERIAAQLTTFLIAGLQAPNLDAVEGPNERGSVFGRDSAHSQEESGKGR